MSLRDRALHAGKLTEALTRAVAEAEIQLKASEPAEHQVSISNFSSLHLRARSLTSSRTAKVGFLSNLLAFARWWEREGT